MEIISVILTIPAILVIAWSIGRIFQVKAFDTFMRKYIHDLFERNDAKIEEYYDLDTTHKEWQWFVDNELVMEDVDLVATWKHFKKSAPWDFNFDLMVVTNTSSSYPMREIVQRLCANRPT